MVPFRDELEKLLQGALPVLEAMADEVMVIDRDFNIVWINETKRRHFPHAALDQKCYEVFERRSAVCEHCAIFEAIETGKPCRKSDHTHTENGMDWYGHPFVNDISASPLRNAAGDIVGCIEVVRDISDSYRTRRRLAALTEEMKNVLHVLSHDLISPLVSIQGFVSKIERRYGQHFDDKGQHYIRRITENIGFMDQLIKVLLDTSRLLRQELHLKDVDLRTLTAETAAQVEQALAQRQGRIEIVEPLPGAHCDPVRIGQVLLNLMGNAIKFAEEGRPLVLTIGFSNGSYFVQDNGPGIEPECHQKIFQPFTRATSKNVPGLGMGLHIVREIIDKHGGRIWVDPEYRDGARFRFTLPPRMPEETTDLS